MLTIRGANGKIKSSVDSVNGDTGDVVLTASDVGASATGHTHTAAEVGAAATVHTHVAADTIDFSEAVDDRVASLLVAGTNMTLTYDDVANTLTLDAV